MIWNILPQQNIFLANHPWISWEIFTRFRDYSVTATDWKFGTWKTSAFGKFYWVRRWESKGNFSFHLDAYIQETLDIYTPRNELQRRCLGQNINQCSGHCSLIPEVVPESWSLNLEVPDKTCQVILSFDGSTVLARLRFAATRLRSS